MSHNPGPDIQNNQKDVRIRIQPGILSEIKENIKEHKQTPFFFHEWKKPALKASTRPLIRMGTQ
jgi:hypothetical protein